jgi:tripartite-type tricarboxylate transporter receptor subunit TctC
MSITRRAALAVPLLAAPAFAQARWVPERAMRMIIPWAPGGSSDVQLRNLADLASRALGQTVVAETRGGAGGTLHAVHLAREARPGGVAA